MKHTILLIVLAMLLGACASNQSAKSEKETAASTDMPEGKKKVCKYERNSGGTSRMKRVCRYVDVDAEEAK